MESTAKTQQGPPNLPRLVTHRWQTIDDDIYSFWMRLRRDAYADADYRPLGEALPDYTYKQSWTMQKALSVLTPTHTILANSWMK